MIWAAVVLAMPACVEVEGERILARHLAAAVPAFATISPEESLGWAPAPGARRVFAQRELAALARRHGIETPVEAEACFERPAERLEADRVRAALDAALSAPAQIELLEFSRNAVPRGELEFARIRLPDKPGLIVWRGSVRAGARSVPVWARVRVTPAPREVERGDQVTVEVASGAARLTFQARAETAGRAGETVLLKSPAGARRLAARVQGPGKVVIDANPAAHSRSGAGR